jgi:hypothetical protein
MLEKERRHRLCPRNQAVMFNIELDGCHLDRMRNDETKASLKAEHERFIITELSTNGNEKKYY